jgi:hypothetical protein
MASYAKVFLAGTITGQITVRTSPDIALFEIETVLGQDRVTERVQARGDLARFVVEKKLKPGDQVLVHGELVQGNRQGEFFTLAHRLSHDESAIWRLAHGA